MIQQFQKQRGADYYQKVVLFTNNNMEYAQRDKGVLANWNNSEALYVVYLGENGISMYALFIYLLYLFIYFIYSLYLFFYLFIQMFI
jgi:hypothetical protein